MLSVACTAEAHDLCQVGDCVCECHIAKGEFSEACQYGDHDICDGDGCECACHDEDDEPVDN